MASPRQPAHPCSPPPEPQTFADLLHRLPDLNYLIYTGRAKHTLRLDASSGAHRATWASKSWRALWCLNAYAHAKSANFPGAFLDYCKDPAFADVAIPLRQIAPGESSTVGNRWGHERVFPVPPRVRAEGAAMMSAHIKIACRGNVSPRIHYLDDTATTGLVVIGWIGRHLTNTRT